MMMKKGILLFLFLISSLYSMGQGFVYSYDDPCTSKTTEIYIDNPNGSTALFYGGQTQSFTGTQLQSGAVQQWINQINSSNPLGPCSGVGLAQNVTVNASIATNNISVLTSVLSTLSSITSVAASVTTSTVSSVGGSAIGGIVQADEKASSNNDNGEKDDSTPNTNNSTTTKTNDSTGNNQNSPTVSENNQSQGQNVSEGSSSSGGGTLTGGANAVKADTNEKNEKQEQSKEEAKEEAQSSSAQSSSSTKSKVAAVKQGSLMMTGDIVTISSASGSDPTQLKINSSIIMSNTKNTFAKGALINFTSAVNNTNVTLFLSFRKKKLTTIFANSTMMNFQKDLFNTTSIMESYQYHKITGTVGINFTMGNIGESKFQSLSTLGGIIGTFKVNKKFGMTTMFVMVYSPYVFYYEGMWNKSGYIAVPFLSIDYKLTKKFKLNVSFSGVNQINDKTLNYQVLFGAKALL